MFTLTVRGPILDVTSKVGPRAVSVNHHSLMHSALQDILNVVQKHCPKVRFRVMFL